MKIAVKALIALGLVAAVMALAAIRPMDAQGSNAAVLREKDQSRLASEGVTDSGVNYADNLLQLAHAAKPPAVRRSGWSDMAAAEGPRGMGGFGPPGAGPGRAFPPPPAGPMVRDRRACVESIDRGAGMAGYLKSKLNLDGAQKDAWQKIEQAAEPVVLRMRQMCGTLPEEPGPPPNFPAMMAMADQQFAVRAEFVHAILPPATALYGMLSSEQRAILDRPPPPVL